LESPSAASRNAAFNRRQLVALWVGLALFSLAALFPPWQEQIELLRIEQPLGRHAWWSPPVRSVVTSESRFLQSQHQALVPSARVHYAQLGVELIVVTLLTGGLVVTLHRRRSQEEVGAVAPRSS
jgi:hypothetical protein